jgi:hypothetical protein
MNEQKATEVSESKAAPLEKGSLDSTVKKAWRPGVSDLENPDSQKLGDEGSHSDDEDSFDIEMVKPALKVFAKGLDEDSDDAENCIGTVDHMDGDRYIKLAKSGSSDGNHHWVPIGWVDCVAEGAVYLNKSADEVSASMLNSLPIESLN